jgi:hypothetical protein
MHKAIQQKAKKKKSFIFKAEEEAQEVREKQGVPGLSRNQSEERTGKIQPRRTKKVFIRDPKR